MILAQWVLATFCFAVFLFLSGRNACILYVNDCRRAGVSSVAVVGGLAGMWALLVVPIKGAAWFAWMPLLLDPGSCFLMTNVAWFLSWRAVHRFDIFRDLTGGDVERVYAVTWNPPWGEYAGDSTAMITLEVDNGVKAMWEGAKCNASNLNSWGQDYLRAECEHGTLELDRRELRVLRHDVGLDRPVATPLPLLERESWTNAWLVERLCDWLSGRRGSHPTRLEDNIQAMATLFAALESAHTGRVVEVQPLVREARGA